MPTRRQIQVKVPESKWRESGAAMAMSAEEIFTGLALDNMEEVVIITQLYRPESALQVLILQHDSYAEVEEGVEAPIFELDDPQIIPPAKKNGP